MTFWHFMKSGYTKGLVALCMTQMLSACDSEEPVTGGGPVIIGTGSISVNWSKPTLREDDITALSASEIGGYRIYYGSTTGEYPNEIDITSDGKVNGTITVNDLPTGSTYYFVITTYDTAGRESLHSQEIEITI